MLLLLIFAFIAGLVTILSPCILPVLPIVLSSSVGGGKSRPFGVVTGFILSFTFFTLFLSTLVRFTGISADSLRYLSIAVTLGFGISLFIPRAQIFLERLVGQFSGHIPKTDPNSNGFKPGLIIGVSLGLLWTPCVGPILASVITLAATSQVNFGAVLITLSYSIGTAIPMIAVILGGRQLLQKVPALVSNTGRIQKLFGVVMIVTAMAMFFNIDRTFQTFILDKFPQYGVGLTTFENNDTVKQQLQKLQGKKVDTTATGKPMFDVNSQQYPDASEIIPGGKWFNLPSGSQKLTMSELKGKVVLVDFWTYTCINCIRTLPYLKTWNEKYKDKGLVIIGVHTPEFEFEKNADNVARALKDFGITYPVVQDNEYATWNAYNNSYWPAKYFIDKNGKIRMSHFGEGQYDESEKFIQKLLAETGADVSNMPVSNPTYDIQAQTPETYLGGARLGSLVSPEAVQTGQKQTFSAPSEISQNTFAYEGPWLITSERAQPFKGGKLLFRFNAAHVYLVMRPKEGSSGNVRVMIDGKSLDSSAGIDVVSDQVHVNTDRLYTLINLSQASTHLLELEAQDDNIELYAFTFG
jgi:cytochrome c biogenesis protein CcdA/peroxiredoxin